MRSRTHDGLPSFFFPECLYLFLDTVQKYLGKTEKNIWNIQEVDRSIILYKVSVGVPWIPQGLFKTFFAKMLTREGRAIF